MKGIPAKGPTLKKNKGPLKVYTTFLSVNESRHLSETFSSGKNTKPQATKSYDRVDAFWGCDLKSLCFWGCVYTTLPANNSDSSYAHLAWFYSRSCPITPNLCLFLQWKAINDNSHSMYKSSLPARHSDELKPFHDPKDKNTEQQHILIIERIFKLQTTSFVLFWSVHYYRSRTTWIPNKSGGNVIIIILIKLVKCWCLDWWANMQYVQIILCSCVFN